MLKLKRGKIQTNIGSGYDRLSRVEKEQLLASLKERLGPRVDPTLANISLRAANSNIQWACNLYLRTLLKTSTPEQARTSIRKLFRLNAPPHETTPTSRTSSSTTTGHGNTSSRLILPLLPEALIHHIGLSLDLCSIFALSHVSRDMHATFNQEHSDEHSNDYWKFYGKIVYPLKRRDGEEGGTVAKKVSSPHTTTAAATSASTVRTSAAAATTSATTNETTFVSTAMVDQKEPPSPATYRYSHPTDPPSNRSNWYQVVLRSKMCEHYGVCPRCSITSLKMKTFKQCQQELLRHQKQHCLLPCVFGFPSNELIHLSKSNVIKLGEDHILEESSSPIWVCKHCDAGFGSWPFAYALSCG